jgi:hypothetical protein
MTVPATIATDRLERLQLPDIRRPERTPSWPAWVASRIDAVKVEWQPDRTTGKWREVPTLPANLILMAAEREELERHIGDLDQICGRTPSTHAEAEKEMLVLLTGLMMTLPSTAQNELAAEARGEAFMDALEDLPPWSVRSAIRRWHRGDCGNNHKGETYDYHWCPAPAELRRVAWTEMYRVSARAETIRTLLQAEPLLEFSDEHRRHMRERLAELYRKLETPLVGKDGSGGADGGAPADGAHCGTQPKHGPA